MDFDFYNNNLKFSHLIKNKQMIVLNIIQRPNNLST